MNNVADDRAAVRTVLERVDLERLGRSIDLKLRDLPYYEPCEQKWLDDQGTPVIYWNLRLFLRWLGEGTSPSQDEVATLRAVLRDGAVRGKRMQEQLVVYNSGTQLVWESLLNEATDSERSALASFSEIVLDYQRVVLQAFTASYRAQEDMPVTGERRAAVLLDWLSTADPVTPDALSQTQLVGFRLANVYRPFVATVREARTVAYAELAQRLREAGALAVTKEDRIEGLTQENFDWDVFLHDPRLLVSVDNLTARPHLRVAFEDLRTVAVAAREADGSGMVTVEEFLPQLLLSRAPRIADRVVERVFAPLADHEGEELAATIRTLVANNFDRAATAAALPAHRNTVLYRIKRVEKITGLDFSNPRDLTVIWLASLRFNTYGQQ